MTATFYVGDAIETMNKLPESSVDLVLTSPPFLALRSYLPADHPDKAKEGGSQATPGEYIDWLLDVVEACARVLAPHGSLCFELGDTYAGSGGSGGDYEPSGLREGQERFTGSGARQWQAKFQREQKPGYEHSFPVHRGPAAGGGKGWALPKSLSLIPETFRWAMVYGHNPFTGRTTEPWRLRNVIRWVRPNPPVGALCVDDQTEALTLDGWKRHDQLSDGDLIASYDLKTDSIRFLPATFVRYEREGEPMVVIDKKATSQWFTEYHRCLVKTRKGGVQVRLAQDLTNECDTLLCAPFEDVAGPAPVTTTRAALLGWYVAEGSPRHRQARIVQSATANPGKVAEIRRLLEADGADFTETVYRHRYNDSDIVTFTIKGELAEWLNLHHHRLPMMYATTWPEAQAQALFDALIDGDGHRRKNAEGMLFHQQDEATADVVQTLAIRLGWRASKSWQPSMNIWQVTIGRRSRWTAIRKWEGSGIRREVYTGTVWCPQVETGFWLARRNGKTFITGNSDKFRPATSELMVFCKAKDRYFDLDAVRESPKQHSVKYDGGTRPIPDSDPHLLKPRPGGDMNPAGAPPLDWWNIPLTGEPCLTCGGVGWFWTDAEHSEEGKAPCPACQGSGIQGAERYGPKQRETKPEQGEPKQNQAKVQGVVGTYVAMADRTFHQRGGAPPLDWWNIPPGGYDGAHYAVFPKELLVKPIKAMCPWRVCLGCGLVLGLGHDTTNSNTMPGMRRTDHGDLGKVAGRTTKAALLSDMSQSNHGTQSEIDEGVDQEFEGLHLDSETRSSDGGSRGIRHGASASDGRTPRTLFDVERSGSSQERNQGRQPDRELGTVDQGGSRSAFEAVAETPSVSSLRRINSDVSECPACGGELRPGRVLDPFAGSGTTLAVATGHGRDAVGIDLDERNYTLALDRVGPLVLTRGEVAA